MKRLLLIGLLLMSLTSACGSVGSPSEARLLPTEAILPTTTLRVITLAPTSTATPQVTPSATQTPKPVPTQTPLPTLVPTMIEPPTITPTEVRYAYIAIAIKPIPAGYAIPPDAVTLYPWPVDTVPFTSILTVDDVVNKVALTDIHCFEPFVEAGLALREAGFGFEELESCPSLPPQTGVVTFTNVVVATQYVDAGVTIRPGMVSMRRWPIEIRPVGAIGRFADVIGKETLGQLIPEQPIYAEMLMEP